MRNRWHLRPCAPIVPRSPGPASGFIGGISTAAGILYPLIFSSGANIHIGYFYVALFMFLPIVLFYFWAARFERAPEEHGIGTPPIKKKRNLENGWRRAF